MTDGERFGDDELRRDDGATWRELFRVRLRVLVVFAPAESQLGTSG